MLSLEDIKYTIDQLQGDDPSGILKVIIKDNKADLKTIPYIEKLLTDIRPCCLYLKPTYTYGEIRYAAAYALMNQCKILNIKKKIILPNCVIPVTAGDMGVIEKENNLTIKTSGETTQEECCDLFVQLRALGKLPMKDFEFNL
jgi:hypothetical protein